MPQKYWPLIITLGLFASLANLANAGDLKPQPVPSVVKVESGDLQGVSADGVLAFKGIPFAAPPVGNLRWRPPQPVKPWVGVRSAADYAHDSMQLPFPSDAAPLGTPPDEDCLYLNVWRPAGVSDRPLPVMIWIYGGGFVNGGSSPAVYDGSQFARQGLVFVSFNYRLGRFGFFAHPALTKEHPDELHGDYAYMDQIAALKWVQKNIAAFGGNPSQVTIFGESAGGASVHMLLTSPLTKGLFQRAIIQSGGGRNLLATPGGIAAAEAQGLAFASSKGISGQGDEALAALRQLPAEQLVDHLNLMSMSGAAATYSGPITDGTIVVQTAEQAYLSGEFVRVPVMVGATDEDIGSSSAKTVDEALMPFGVEKEKANQVYNPDGKLSGSALGTLIARDRMMLEPARFVARVFSAAGQPAYYYRFSYVAESLRKENESVPGHPKGGAQHASEIPYVFNTVAAKYGPKLTAKERKVAEATNAYWANFAKTGNPNGPGLPLWPGYTPANEELMDFTSAGRPEANPDPLRARLDLTASLAGAPKSK